MRQRDVDSFDAPLKRRIVAGVLPYPLHESFMNFLHKIFVDRNGPFFFQNLPQCRCMIGDFQVLDERLVRDEGLLENNRLCLPFRKGRAFDGRRVVGML